jgi:hypothetical protein
VQAITAAAAMRTESATFRWLILQSLSENERMPRALAKALLVRFPPYSS